MNKIIIILVICFFLLSCQSHNNQDGSPKQISCVDGLGRTVKLAKPAERIISMAPSLTEIVYALNVQDKLCARTDYCDFPAEAKNKPSIGKALNPSIEQIVAFSPDLILMTTEGNLKEAGRRIMELGFSVYVSNPRKLKDIALDVRSIGILTNSTDKANIIATSFEKKITPIKNKKGKSPRLIYLVWPDPLIPAGKGNYIDDLIKISGAVNPASFSKTSWPRITMETLITMNPDIIIYSRSDSWNENIDKLISRKEWKLLPAVQENRIYEIDENIINRPSLRITNALNFFHEKVMAYEIDNSQERENR